MIPIMGGCESVNQGLSDFADTMSPKTPRQAAEMSLDQNNPDKRSE